MHNERTALSVCCCRGYLKVHITITVHQLCLRCKIYKGWLEWVEWVSFPFFFKMPIISRHFNYISNTVGHWYLSCKLTLIVWQRVVVPEYDTGIANKMYQARSVAVWLIFPCQQSSARSLPVTGEALGKMWLPWLAECSCSCYVNRYLRLRGLPSNGLACIRSCYKFYGSRR